jgi:hypothetical protein
MTVNSNMAYATWRWNHMDSSSGRNLILGRMTRRIFRHMGITMTMVSTDKTRPAPREIQTENWRALRGARRISPCCFHLQSCQLGDREGEMNRAYHPIANNAQWKPQKTKLKASFRGAKKPFMTDGCPMVPTCNLERIAIRSSLSKRKHQTSRSTVIRRRIKCVQSKRRPEVKGTSRC